MCLGTCRVAPPPPPWIEVVGEKQTVGRGSRREEDCARRGEREQETMAENKIGPNLQAGAGFIAKRVQKSLNRAQEKVSQRSHSRWLRLSSELYKVVSAIRSVLNLWKETCPCWGVGSCPDILDLKCGTVVKLLVMTYVAVLFQLCHNPTGLTPDLSAAGFSNLYLISRSELERCAGCTLRQKPPLPACILPLCSVFPTEVHFSAATEVCLLPGAAF